MLPPSEGKTAPQTGPALDLEGLSFPALTRHRVKVAKTLATVSKRRSALEVLGVGASLGAEVARNTELFAAPCAPAAKVYSGVLYDAAGMGTWDAAAIARASGSVVTVSALWGVVSPADLIPAYRLSMDTDLPGIGRLAPWWKPQLAKALATRAESELIVDCRSSAYLAAWTPPASAEHVTVTVVRERAGKRSVVSHMAKHTRGVLAGFLALGDAAPANPEDLAHSATALTMPGLGSAGVAAVELESRKAAGKAKAYVLTLVVRD